MSHRIRYDDVTFGDRWVDQLGNVTIARVQNITNEAYRDTPHILTFFDHNRDGQLDVVLQFNHDYQLDNNIRFHIHLIPMANGAGNAYFTYNYFYASTDTVIPANASWTSGSVTVPLVAGDQYKSTFAPLFNFTPAGDTTSSILLCTLIREATNVLDTYSTNKDHGTAVANLASLYIDAHYQGQT
jgi:hypothetical protein